jgi:MoxR-like ATPase
MSTPGDRITQLLDEFRHSRDVMVTELNKVIIGQREVIELILAAIFTRGHVLLVGVPGLAKTLMVSSIARILDVSFKRIQFTPDLMPSDITGTNVLEEPEAGHRAFRFVAGPLFANIILADEINRTPPKTQAALLQAMQEREVTVGQETMHLPEPFFVIATQNPIEQEGTYPLPEAQLDRFMFDIRVGYPSLEEEKKILLATTKGETPELKKVLSGKAIVNLQKLVTSVPVSEYTVDYVTRLVRATRPADEKAPQFIKELVDYGAGPRAGQNLILAGKAMAAMDGRFSVSLDDIRKVAVPVLRHRISTNFQAQAEGQSTDTLVKRLISEIREPETPKYERPSPAKA